MSSSKNSARYKTPGLWDVTWITKFSSPMKWIVWTDNEWRVGNITVYISTDSRQQMTLYKLANLTRWWIWPQQLIYPFL